MAKKSKTQKARASARRAERKAQGTTEEDSAIKAASSDTADTASASSKPAVKAAKKEETKAVKETKPAKKFSFLSDVRLEMKRVTWPTRQDVLRWSGVVVAALVFFSVFVFVLDSWIVTPVLVGISSIGA